MCGNGHPHGITRNGTIRFCRKISILRISIRPRRISNYANCHKPHPLHWIIFTPICPDLFLSLKIFARGRWSRDRPMQRRKNYGCEPTPCSLMWIAQRVRSPGGQRFRCVIRKKKAWSMSNRHAATCQSVRLSIHSLVCQSKHQPHRQPRQPRRPCPHPQKPM